ncbi:MAG: HD domain-containing protein [Planctomycetota bacterium]
MPQDSPQRPDAGGALDALLELLALDDLPRTGWLLRGVRSPESVAGHILGVGYVALALAPRVDPPLDLARVLAMALVHDAPEARSGDLPQPAARHLPAGAKAGMEGAIAEDLLGALSTVAHGGFAEYEAQESREARFVKACDRLHLGVRLVGYERAGTRGLGEFWSTLEAGRFDEFAPCAELARTLRAAREGPR